MKTRTYLTLALLGIISGMSFSVPSESVAQNSGLPARSTAPSIVKVEKTADGYSLTRNSKPYVIHGGGGSLHLETLKATGGNSVRTWGGEDQTEMLDTCESLGLTVSAGIWLGQPRQGFRYSDKAAVQRQKDSAVSFVKRHKMHPAVLVWGLGNEMEEGGDDPLIWTAIDDAAKAMKAEDPNHPVMTVIAEIGKDGNKLKNFTKYCPNVDILGINSYAGLGSLPERIKAAGFTRPYAITEYGTAGYWEVPKTTWGAQIEPTSAQKAATFLKNYNHSIAEQKAQCLGSYAFLWGQKQEATSTWFGLFLNSGERTEAVETLQFLWAGKYPEVRCPRIVKMECSIGQKEVGANLPQKAEITVQNTDLKTLMVRWEVRRESTDRRAGGDLENQPQAVSDCVTKAVGTKLEFRTPAESGAYRLFVYAYDGRGNAATANVPFLVLSR